MRLIVVGLVLLVGGSWAQHQSPAQDPVGEDPPPKTEPLPSASPVLAAEDVPSEPTAGAGGDEEVPKAGGEAPVTLEVEEEEPAPLAEVELEAELEREEAVIAPAVEPKDQPVEVLAEDEEQLSEPKETIPPTQEPTDPPAEEPLSVAVDTMTPKGPAVLAAAECLQDTDCSQREKCSDQACIDGCAGVELCLGTAVCTTRYHKPTCVCPITFTAVRLSSGGSERYECKPRALMGVRGRPRGRRPSDSSGRPRGSRRRPLTPVAFYRGVNNPLSQESVGTGSSQERVTTGVSRPISASRPISSRPFSRPVYDRPSTDPCRPNPCGPNTRCSLNANGIALCRCIDGYVPEGNTINGCKPQCIRDDECPDDYRCRSEKCERVCVKGACATGAYCKARNHRAVCSCPPGYLGDAHTRCVRERPEVRDPPQDLPVDPCNPSPCGVDAECRTRGERPVCSCRLGYEGDPLSFCRRGECIETSECPGHQVCQSLRCVNPCDSSTCGRYADCKVVNHVPVCSCPNKYVGDPLTACRPFNPQELCSPSPCGENTNCKVRNDRAVCSCYENYIGDPLTGCKPECVSDGECPFNMACRNNICVNPCRDACGENAYCDVKNGRAVCSCPDYYQGDPHSRCYAECTAHDDCPSYQACYQLRCTDPCEGACGTGANCKVEDHKPICSCPKGYTGHPFERCRPFTSADLCNPNPCGSGADCTPGFDRNGENRPVCTCPVGFIGNPLISCSRGECSDHSQCPATQACYRYVCSDPCYTDVGSVCGENAVCSVKNHEPVCSCPRGYEGDPRHECRPGVGSYVPGRGHRN